MKKSSIKIGLKIGALAIVGLILFFLSCTIIPTGYVGVRTTFGQVDESTVPNGFNWKIPFAQTIEKVNVKMIDVAFPQRVWSETSERTALFFENTTVTYQIASDRAAWIFANVSNYTESLVSGELVSSSIKSISKTLKDTDVTNRATIEPSIQEALQNTLDNKFGAGTVFIKKVVVGNIDFEDSYNDAIADKQAAKLEAERQAIENNANVARAEAEAEAKIIKAQADAEALIIEAEAQAEANKKLAASITDEILDSRFYDIWNGQLPYVVSDGSTILDVSDMIRDANTEQE